MNDDRRAVQCPTCGKIVHVRNGRYRKHKGLWPINVPEHPTCPKSGEPVD